MKMSEGGRVVIPAEIRRQLKLSDGDVICFELLDGEVRLMSKAQRMERARLAFLEQVPKVAGRSLADELIQERRASAALE